MSSNFDYEPRRPRAIAISRADFARLHAVPFTTDDNLHVRALLAAALPAIGIIVVAAAVLSGFH